MSIAHAILAHLQTTVLAWLLDIYIGLQFIVLTAAVLSDAAKVASKLLLEAFTEIKILHL